MEKVAERTTVRKRVAKPKTETVSARDRIKPRGLFGIMKGKIHYDEDADIFNLD